MEAKTQEEYDSVIALGSGERRHIYIEGATEKINLRGAKNVDIHVYESSVCGTIGEGTVLEANIGAIGLVSAPDAPDACAWVQDGAQIELRWFEGRVSVLGGIVIVVRCSDVEVSDGPSIVTASESRIYATHGTISLEGGNVLHATRRALVRIGGYPDRVYASGGAVIQNHGYDNSNIVSAVGAVVQVDDRRRGAEPVPAGAVMAPRGPRTLGEWMAQRAVRTTDDGLRAIVYKAVNENLHSGWDFHYPIGEKVAAPDWNPIADCGQGLHFCATPMEAERYYGLAERYLECEVPVDSVVFLEDDKIKAPWCLVIREVDRFMEPID